MDINKLYEPIDYTMKLNGKNIRKHIILYIQTLLKNKNTHLTNTIIDDITTTHNASLIIDDIHDLSVRRRGKICAYLLFGKPLTLNAGYLKTLHILNTIDKRYPKNIANKVKNLYIDSFYKGHIGQGLDIYWTITKYIPTLEEYILMVDNKTGIMFNTCAKICILTCENKIPRSTYNSLILLMTFIGRFFQIRDDYINLTCPKYWKLKGFCEDLDNENVSYVLCILKHFYPNIKIKTPYNKYKTYKMLYKKYIFNIVYAILERYKVHIIEIEKTLTQKKTPSTYLSDFFKKLTYDKAMHYSKITNKH